MHTVHESNLSAVDLNLLVVLEALLSERHVTRAASRVGLSQSATSHALNRLRELYRDPLLVRSGKSMSLTPTAAALLPSLSRGLSELRATLSQEPVFDPKSTRRAFSLTMVDYAQLLLLPKMLAHLGREAPLVDLSIINEANWIEPLQAGTIDLAFHVAGSVHSGMHSRALFSDGFVCMIRKGHPVARAREPLTLAKYLSMQHVVVAPSGAPGSVVDSELERRGKSRRVALRVPNFLVTPGVVSESDFISTLPERLARHLAKLHPVTLLAPPVPLPRFTMSLAWHARLDNDPAHRWLREVVFKLVGALA
jgi:DNA-binding transcriptional LysR family regulator